MVKWNKLQERTKISNVKIFCSMVRLESEKKEPVEPFELMPWMSKRALEQISWKQKSHTVLIHRRAKIFRCRVISPMVTFSTARRRIGLSCLRSGTLRIAARRNYGRWKNVAAPKLTNSLTGLKKILHLNWTLSLKIGQGSGCWKAVKLSQGKSHDQEFVGLSPSGCRGRGHDLAVRVAAWSCKGTHVQSQVFPSVVFLL